MTELAYDERATNFSTTNTTVYATTGTGGADPIIGSLDATVVGTGAAVEVEFYCPAMYHTAQLMVTSYLVINGAVTAALSQYRNWATAQNVSVVQPTEGGSMRRRLILTNGTSYTFKVGLSAVGSGITTAFGSVASGGASAGVMYLRVTD